MESHTDHISDISVEGVRGGRYAHCTSGDGTMSTFNLRKNKLFIVSDAELKCDYTSVCSLDSAKKVVVGTLEGEMLLYNYNEYAMSADRMPGHTGEISSIVEYISPKENHEDANNIIITADEEGVIRAVNISPNRYLGVIGQAANDDSILRLNLIGDDKTNQNELISLSDSGHIQFYNLDFLDKLGEIKSTDKVAGKLKGSASIMHSQRNAFINKLEKDEIKMPENVSDSDSDSWQDVQEDSSDSD